MLPARSNTRAKSTCSTLARRDGWFRPWVPDWGQLDGFALGLSLLAAVALLRLRFSILGTLALCGAIGDPPDDARACAANHRAPPAAARWSLVAPVR